MVGEAQSGSALRLTWTAVHTGNNISGVASLVKPAQNVPAQGSLTGALSGSTISLTYAAAAGSVSGFPACAVTGTGSGDATSSAIAGTLRLTFTSCAGSGLEATGSERLSLTKP